MPRLGALETGLLTTICHQSTQPQRSPHRFHLFSGQPTAPCTCPSGWPTAHVACVMFARARSKRSAHRSLHLPQRLAHRSLHLPQRLAHRSLRAPQRLAHRSCRELGARTRTAVSCHRSRCNAVVRPLIPSRCLTMCSAREHPSQHSAPLGNCATSSRAMPGKVQDAFVLVDKVCPMLGTYSCYFARGGQNTLVAKKPLDLPPQKKPSRGALPLYKLRVSWYTSAKVRPLRARPHRAEQASQVVGRRGRAPLQEGLVHSRAEEVLGVARRHNS